MRAAKSYRNHIFPNINFLKRDMERHIEKNVLYALYARTAACEYTLFLSIENVYRVQQHFVVYFLFFFSGMANRESNRKGPANHKSNKCDSIIISKMCNIYLAQIGEIGSARYSISDTRFGHDSSSSSESLLIFLVVASLGAKRNARGQKEINCDLLCYLRSDGQLNPKARDKRLEN